MGIVTYALARDEVEAVRDLEPRYYRVGLGSKITGPYDVQTLVGWARTGALSPFDKVLRWGGSLYWITAKSDPELLEACKGIPGWDPTCGGAS